MTSAACAFSTPAAALDKQAPAHGGEVGDDDEERFDVSGALTLGASLYNPSYGARPDNTGHALMRYAAHVDVDLIGRKLSIPLDVNVFSDRDRRGASKLSPTELDGIAGVTTAWSIGRGHVLELGSRVEHDRPVDTGTFTQTYVDVRGRWIFDFARTFPELSRSLGDSDVTGSATLGWFAYNPTYAARPDNSGIALLRYGLRTELSVLDDLFSLGADTTWFTERSRAVRPTELDLTVDLITHFAPWEVHLAYERDLPLDRRGTRPGYTQQFVYALLGWSFDLHGLNDKPLHERGTVSSP